MTDTKTLTSPVGTILFSALRTAKQNYEKTKMEYSLRLEIDGDAKGADEFKKALKAINRALVITEDKQGNSIVAKEGNYIINAKSINAPKVFDKDNEMLAQDEIPMITSGTAVVVLKEFTGKSGKGNGVNLVGVQLLDIVEFQGTKSTVNENELLSALKARHG